MSTLIATTAQSANGSTDFTLQSGNTAGAKIVISANGGGIQFYGNSSTIINTANSIAFNLPTTVNLSGNSTALGAILVSPAEPVSINTTATTGTSTLYLNSGSIFYNTSNAIANFAPNVAWSSTTTLNNAMANNQVVTFIWMVTQGATAYVCNTMYIDGSAITPKWQGGTAPTSGDVGSIDVYSFSIIKTGTSTYTALASQSQYK